MPYHSGQGGKLNAITTDVEITDWELTRTARLAEVTTSGSGHVIRHFVVEDGNWRVNLPWDSVAIPDTDLSLAPGDSIPGTDLWLGNSGKFYTFDGIVETLQIVNNSTNDVVRAVVSGFVNSTITEPLT